jgi:uncharacterized protein with beta-barrel porin domain
MSSWWLLWTIFIFVFLLSPIGYGWGYREWGPPYPRYVQRRRVQQAAAAGGSAQFNHQSWGWGGDLVWMGLLIGMLWAVSATVWAFSSLWWR